MNVANRFGSFAASTTYVERPSAAVVTVTVSPVSRGTRCVPTSAGSGAVGAAVELGAVVTGVDAAGAPAWAAPGWAWVGNAGTSSNAAPVIAAVRARAGRAADMYTSC